LPDLKKLETLLPHSFVLYEPKDIVSGDFYWYTEKKEHLWIAAVDCTGHGVPGAFMSLIGSSLLRRVTHPLEDANMGQVLKEFNDEVRKTLKQDQAASSSQDGMDVAICKIDKNRRQIEFAGANRPFYLIQNKELIEVKGDKIPIGGSQFISENNKFTNHKFQLKPGDTFYLFSDGYADQFGGPKGKKLLTKRFKSYLIEIQGLSMAKQKQALINKLKAWRNDLEQVDDIMVIGIRM